MYELSPPEAVLMAQQADIARQAQNASRPKGPMLPDERYRIDPSFKHLVDMMEAMMQQADFTPSEMRTAAVLASINFEHHRIRRSLTMGDVRYNLYSGLNDLHEKMNEIVKADGL